MALPCCPPFAQGGLFFALRHSTTVSTLKKLCDGLEITMVDFFRSPLFSQLEQELR